MEKTDTNAHTPSSRMKPASALMLDRPGAVITLVGDPGAGETTIWVELLAGRSAAWMWTARCLQVEAGVGLAMLTDLFATLPETVVDRLPALQRHAMDVVLCREVDQGEGRLGERLVGMTTLTAVPELPASGPVVHGIDDLQWADPTSLDALPLLRVTDCGRAVDHQCEPPNFRTAW